MQVPELPEQGVVWYVAGVNGSGPQVLHAFDFRTGASLRVDAGRRWFTTADGRFIMPPGTAGWAEAEFEPSDGTLTALLRSPASGMPAPVFRWWASRASSSENEQESASWEGSVLTIGTTFNVVRLRYDNDGVLTARANGDGAWQEMAPAAVDSLPEFLWPQNRMEVYAAGFEPDAKLETPADTAWFEAKIPGSAKPAEVVIAAPSQPVQPIEPSLGSGPLSTGSALPTALVITGVIVAVLGVIGWFRSRS